MSDDEFYPECQAAGADMGPAFAALAAASLGKPQTNTAPVMAPANTPLASLPAYYQAQSLGVPVGSQNWQIYQAAMRDAIVKLGGQQTVAPTAAQTQAADTALSQQAATLTGPEPTTAQEYLARGALRTGKIYTDPANATMWTQLAASDNEKAKTVLASAAPGQVLTPAQIAAVLTAPIPQYNAPVELQKWTIYYLGLSHNLQVHV